MKWGQCPGTIVGDDVVIVKGLEGWLLVKWTLW